jgi:hypothetical protein
LDPTTAASTAAHQVKASSTPHAPRARPIGPRLPMSAEANVMSLIAIVGGLGLLVGVGRLARLRY